MLFVCFVLFCFVGLFVWFVLFCFVCLFVYFLHVCNRDREVVLALAIYNLKLDDFEHICISSRGSTFVKNHQMDIPCQFG